MACLTVLAKSLLSMLLWRICVLHQDMCSWLLPARHKMLPHMLQEKLQRRIATAQIKVLQPPRPGKKCLVLDIDYTIFDLNSTAGMFINPEHMLHALHADDVGIPGLHA